MIRLFLIVALSAFTAIASAHADDKKPEDFGTFSKGLLNDLLDEAPLIQLKANLVFTDANKRRWFVPSGFTSDGASIPDFAKSFIGGNFDGRYRKAAVVHDYYCKRRTVDWEDVHTAFYNGMRAAGVGERTANVMYLAVYYFGPRWLNQAQRDKECVGKKFDPKKCILNAGVPPVFEPPLNKQSFDIFLNELRKRDLGSEADQLQEEVEIK
jgi:hypothetical protein